MALGRSTQSSARIVALGGLAVLSTLGSVAAQSLKEVIAKQDNLTTFADIIEEYSDVYKNLPRSGVTVIAPNDGAFVKGQGWDAIEEAVPVWLRYGMLRGEVPLGAMEPGDTMTVSSVLDDQRYSNVSDGQQVFITMQPNEDVVITSGTGTRVTVVKADIPFDNGLVHIVESLTVTPRRLEPSIRDSYMDLTSFLGALYQAGLVQEFAETPNATIFAPHNEAFQRLGGTFDDMDEDEFRRILRYHLVPNNVLRAAFLEDGSALDTLAETPLRVTRYINDIYVSTGKVVQTDLLIANGVIQMIDNVLNVNQDDAKPKVSQTTQAPAFSATGSPSVGPGAPVPFTSALPCTADCTSDRPRPTGEGGDDEGGDGDGNGNGARRCAGMWPGVAAGVLGMGVMGMV